jgi:uncharacterized protein with beta-barrel porin domain
MASFGRAANAPAWPFAKCRLLRSERKAAWLASWRSWAASPVLMAAFVCGLLAALSTPPAWADGGTGGSCAGSAGGAGGTGFTGNAGGTPTQFLSCAGGGGGGAGGGNGGNGGGSSHVGGGGQGGISSSPNGQPGGGAANGAFTGGGGGGGFNGIDQANIANTSARSGGNGGMGGDGDPIIGGGGGGGGAGGYGAIITGAGASSNGITGTITGGNGGAGGISGTASVFGGNGGAGGVGVQFTAVGVIFTNSGTVTGGNGGAAGAALGAGSAGTAAAGGAGIVGSGLTIINSGAISGGFANAGSGVQANAITFTGGTNALGSTGTITGGISVQGGSFAPALPTSAIGTPLSFNGPLTFASGTQYVIRVSATTSDSATASGVATLTGATVNAQFASGFPSTLSKQYTILTATGGLGSTMFAGLTNTNLPAGFTDSLSYSADNAFLNLTASLGGGTPLNQNQQTVANAINNFFNSGGALPPAFANLFNLTGGNLSNALTQVSGEAATGAERGAFELMNQFLGLMLDPFVYGRGGSSTGGGALGFAPDQEAELPPDVALAYAGLLKEPAKQTFDQRWTAWASAFGGSATTSGNPAVGSNNVTTSTYGYAAGMDYHYSPDTVFGFSLAGGGTNWNLAQGLGTGRSDAFLAGVYGATHQGPLYLAAALAFADNWFTTNRTALGDQLTASFQGQSYSARLEGGYRFAVPVYHGVVGLTPYAAIQAQDFHTPAYSETDLTGGGLGLSYNAMNGTDTRSELGARFDDLTALNNLPLVLRAKLAWAHDWVSNPSLNAAFQSLPGTGFTVNGAPIPHDTALTSAGAQLFFTPNWSFLARFDGEFANGYQLYAGSGTLRYTW